jgi:hypothetical protein
MPLRDLHEHPPRDQGSRRLALIARGCSYST